MSKQLSTKRLKLIMKPSQEVIRAIKLKSSLPILACLIGDRRQLRTNSVNLMQNNRELIKEIINGSDDTSIFIRTRGALNIKDQADRSAHKEVGPNK
jgi:hypothetical protein